MLVLLTHLLKWLVQRELRSTSWSGSITEQRRRIRLLLSQQPSLRVRLPQMVEVTYGPARSAAAAETGLASRRFPSRCPFTITEILERDFLPE